MPGIFKDMIGKIGNLFKYNRKNSPSQKINIKGVGGKVNAKNISKINIKNVHKKKKKTITKHNWKGFCKGCYLHKHTNI